MGSTCLASTMSFLRIALFSILAVPALSSINPILRAIDSNNKDGPHFRSFLFPNSHRAVNARLATPSLTSFVSLNAVATRGIQNLPVISEIQNIPRPAQIPFTSFNSAATVGIKKVPALTGSSTSFKSLKAVAAGGKKYVTLVLDNEVSNNVQIPSVKSFTRLNEPQQLVASAQINETPLLSETITTRTSVQRPPTPLTGNNQKLEYLENFQLNGNSLEDFKVELHPEEELVRSG